jgi:hypothetical protein
LQKLRGTPSEGSGNLHKEGLNSKDEVIIERRKCGKSFGEAELSTII